MQYIDLLYQITRKLKNLKEQKKLTKKRQKQNTILKKSAKLFEKNGTNDKQKTSRKQKNTETKKRQGKKYKDKNIERGNTQTDMD